MGKKFFKTKKLYVGIIILIATLSSIFFFPMNIGDRYTCFYHRLFDPPQSATVVDVPINNQDNNSIQDIHTEASHQHSVLLQKYLNRYAFIWWGSVGLLALCVYLFFKLKRNAKVNDSNLTVK